MAPGAWKDLSHQLLVFCNKWCGNLDKHKNQIKSIRQSSETRVAVVAEAKSGVTGPDLSGGGGG